MDFVPTLCLFNDKEKSIFLKYNEVSINHLTIVDTKWPLSDVSIETNLPHKSMFSLRALNGTFNKEFSILCLFIKFLLLFALKR